MTKRYAVSSLVLACSLLITGCETGKQHKEAVGHWNDTRAAVQGSLAAERYKLGNLDDARIAVDQAMLLSPDNPKYLVLSARIYIERNQLEYADRDVSHARKVAPGDGEADYLAGVIYQRWQRPTQALEYYTAACQKSPAKLAGDFCVG